MESGPERRRREGGREGRREGGREKNILDHDAERVTWQKREKNTRKRILNRYN